MKKKNDKPYCADCIHYEPQTDHEGHCYFHSEYTYAAAFCDNFDKVAEI